MIQDMVLEKVKQNKGRDDTKNKLETKVTKKN